jgi:cellobiose phosphorylase
MATPNFPFKTPFGHFSDDGNAYLIGRPDTPRPWANVMSSGTYGVAMTQSGSGYSWLHHASLNRISRWNPDPVKDEAGRALYVRDDKTGAFWSAGWQPARGRPDAYEAIHGVGYTIINSLNEDIQLQWLVFVPYDEPLEVWRLRIKNTSRKPRSLSLWTYLEWDLGDEPGSGRELHRGFVETSFHDDRRVHLAQNRLAPAANAPGRLGNRSWEHVAWHGASLPVREACGDRLAFLGAYGSLQSPAAVKAGRYGGPTTYRWDDAASSLCVPVSLRAGEERSVLFTVGAADSQAQALAKARKFRDFSQVDSAWGRTEVFWDKYMAAFPVKTPDRGFDALTNTWLKYQALSGRLWGRTAYDPSGGARGFRDPLQDSQIFLPLDPQGTRRQIHLHAARQFADGAVPRGWHPRFEQDPPALASDNLLGLPFVLVSYLKETANWAILSETEPFLKRAGEKAAPEASLYAHGWRALENSLARLSPRGLPLIGEADWNDGLNGAGGESSWMGHLLYGLLNDWAELIGHAVLAKALPSGEKKRAARYRRAADKLKAALNRHAWDGEWYWRATTRDGAVLGSRKCREGRIFLNSQTWAVLNGVADAAPRRKALLRSLEKHLYGPHGPLLLAPAYSEPDERVGAVTRYAPGTRDNGGVSLQAAVWALQMECRLGRARKAWELYQAISPVLAAARRPGVYRAEPFVMAQSVHGPASATPGRAEGAWTTGSAAWLHKVCTEGFLGLRPVWDGLQIRPCLPPKWNEAEATRAFRGGVYRVKILREKKLAPGAQRVEVDGRPLDGDVVLPALGDHEVRVRVGRAV